VNETAQHVVTIDVEQLGSGDGAVAGHGYLKIDTPMRTLLVVVVDVLTKCSFEVTTTENEDRVEAFSPNGPHPTFRVGVRPSRQLHLIETVRPELSG
jgi:hypothetical protein